MARELPIQNGRLTTDLDADGHKIKNLSGGTSSVSWDDVTGKPTFATVATSGSYDDLSNKPTIPAPVTVDSALSATSENPVQNKVVTAAVNAKCTVAEAVAEVTRTGDWEWTGPGTYIASASELPADGSEGEMYFTVSDITWVDDTPGFEHWDAFMTTWQWGEEGGGWGWLEAGDYGQDHVHGEDTDVIECYVLDSIFIGRKHNAHGLARLIDLPTKTSDLVNDGSDGEHPFLTSHQTWSDVKPSGGIPATDLASAVQASLGLADTAVQPAEIAAKMPMYPFVTPTFAQTEDWTFSGTAAPSGYHWGMLYVGVEGDEGWRLLSVPDEGSDEPTVQDTSAVPQSYATVSFTTAGVTATRVYVATVAQYTVATYTANSTAAAFEIAVGALPTGVTGKARDCILVIDCTATGAVAPTVTWDTHFHPRTDTATDLAIVEAGKRAVFYISEYAAGEFAVGGWVETDGGNA